MGKGKKFLRNAILGTTLTIGGLGVLYVHAGLGIHYVRSNREIANNPHNNAKDIVQKSRKMVQKSLTPDSGITSAGDPPDPRVPGFAKGDTIKTSFQKALETTSPPDQADEDPALNVLIDQSLRGDWNATKILYDIFWCDEDSCREIFDSISNGDPLNAMGPIQQIKLRLGRMGIDEEEFSKRLYFANLLRDSITGIFENDPIENDYFDYKEFLRFAAWRLPEDNEMYMLLDPAFAIMCGVKDINFFKNAAAIAWNHLNHSEDPNEPWARCDRWKKVLIDLGLNVQ